jgi:YHS domain-containing protein
MVNNKKDPTCGMPVTAGISDTAHYKDKVIGFCSTECKDEFKKAPDANIAAAEIK